MTREGGTDRTDTTGGRAGTGGGIDGGGEPARAVRAAIEGELRLLDSEVRSSPALVSALLDPEFVEFGASGARWDGTSILEVTGDGSVTERAPVDVTGLAGRLLAPGLVHLTYVSAQAGRRVHRSSIWRLTPDGWRLYFHQGTTTGGPDV
ncbi:DUF4440 domain-containing protein [Streptomyces sp. NPDC087420]|uniref:nuclear transport factor 2 family protein n=1 Tax=Streptomyces sp. NPDC087420 TaxID=3365785 RepID=UPI00383713E4